MKLHMKSHIVGAWLALSCLPSCSGEGWDETAPGAMAADADQKGAATDPEIGRIEQAITTSGKCLCGAPKKSFWDDYFSQDEQRLWKETFKLASDIVGTYTSVMGYVDAAVTMAETLGLLEPSVSLEQEILDRLDNIEQTLGTVDTFLVSSEYIRRKNDTYPFAIDAISRAQTLRNWVVDHHLRMAEEAAWDSGILPDVLADLDQLTTNPTHFERAAHLVRDPFAGNARHDDQNQGETEGLWKYFIPDRPPVVNGIVWEWRVGLPSLMRAVAASVEVLTGIYPEISQSVLARTELLSYRSRLIEIRDQLQSGIRCAFTGQYDAARGFYGPRPSRPTSRYDSSPNGLPIVTGMCVDIYSGTVGLAQKVASDGHFPPTSSANYMIKPDLAAFIPHALDDAHAQLKIKLGLFEIQQMIDRLYALANNSPASVLADGRLPSLGIPGMCLGLSGNWAKTIACRTRVLPDRPATVPNPAAKIWRFNAVTGEVVQTSLSPAGTPLRCLSVLPYLDSTVLTRLETWAGVAACNGSDEQRWSYDPEHHILRNALGRVLDVQWGNTAEHTWVWTFDYNLSAAQIWGP